MEPEWVTLRNEIAWDIAKIVSGMDQPHTSAIYLVREWMNGSGLSARIRQAVEHDKAATLNKAEVDARALA